MGVKFGAKNLDADFQTRSRLLLCTIALDLLMLDLDFRCLLRWRCMMRLKYRTMNKVRESEVTIYNEIDSIFHWKSFLSEIMIIVTFWKWFWFLPSDEVWHLVLVLQLLGELLLDRRNFVIMTRYISQPENLKLVMNMLKESSKNIQFEAFHVFKVSRFCYGIMDDFCVCCWQREMLSTVA